MIVRILGEDQLDVSEDAMSELGALDEAVAAACEADDVPAFSAALTALLERVRSAGSARHSDALEPSELVLPSADASLAEVKELLTEEGLIPG